MKWIKLALRFLSVTSLIILLFTNHIAAAVCLLAFACVQLGILISEGASQNKK